MSSTIHRTPKSSIRQSLFFNDLASPGTARRNASGKFTTTSQAAAVSAVWRENFSTSDLPPPPMFTLEDRSHYSLKSGIPDYPVVSPEPSSNPRTPAQTPSKLFSTSSPSHRSLIQRGISNCRVNRVLSGEEGAIGGGDDKGEGPVQGAVHHQPWVMITEVARPEIQRNSLPVGNLDEEEWVTVYGFSRFKFGVIFVNCNILLTIQSQAYAEKVLNKDGMQINGSLIIGALSSRSNNLGFVLSSRSSEVIALSSDRLRNGSRNARESGGTMATSAKSMVSKISDLMFVV
ncbi:hypothetical protein Ccrd_004989 [Cynara cardunculus var. scolymus]|uniref:Nuclear pore complex protein NUP35 n=1 Tax=Cynara cardunculus var. scolymus TaxID=59895 RepID=A0A103XLD5_CYNCS|nr:hypothetical protein Ccrd_004989 [Cynara cardunculus var. scolymus]